MPHGSMLEPNKSQAHVCRFCRAEQNGVFGGPLGLGTENGNGWELSSQTLWLTSQDIVFSTYTHYHSSLSSVQLKLSRLCQEPYFRQPSCRWWRKRSMMTSKCARAFVTKGTFLLDNTLRQKQYLPICRPSQGHLVLRPRGVQGLPWRSDVHNALVRLSIPRLSPQLEGIM